MTVYWYIPNTGWPATASDDELTPEQVLDILDEVDEVDEVDEYYSAAVSSPTEVKTPIETV